MTSLKNTKIAYPERLGLRQPQKIIPYWSPWCLKTSPIFQNKSSYEISPVLELLETSNGYSRRQKTWQLSHLWQFFCSFNHTRCRKSLCSLCWYGKEATECDVDTSRPVKTYIFDVFLEKKVTQIAWPIFSRTLRTHGPYLLTCSDTFFFFSTHEIHNYFNRRGVISCGIFWILNHALITLLFWLKSRLTCLISIFISSYFITIFW